jgi:hypothetical protein
MARKFIHHPKGRSFSRSTSKAPQASNTSVEDIDSLLAELSTLCKSVSSTDLPLVSQQPSLSDLLHHSFKTLYLLRQLHQKLLDTTIYCLPIRWHKQALFHFNKALATPKIQGSSVPCHRRFFIFQKRL